MARLFDGTDDEIRTSIGACNVTAAVTLAVVCRRNQTDYGALIGLHTSGNAATYTLEIESAGNNRIDFSGNADSQTVTMVNADGWCLIAVTKAAGTALPRAHKYVYTSNTWTHADYGGTSPDVASSAGGTVRFGEWQDVDDFAGDIAWAGVWNRSLSDAEVERLAFTAEGIHSTVPVGFWVFDQSLTTQAVVDLTGNGANQSALTGTAVSTGSAPVWNYTDGAWLVIRPQGAAGDNRTGAAPGRAGAQGQDAGAKAAASGGAGRAGSRAQDAGARATSAAAAGQVGARSQSIGVKAEVAATASRAGVRGQDASAPVRTSAPQGRAGAQGADAGTAARSSASVSRTGTRAQDAGVKAEVTAAAGRTGARAQCVGVKAEVAGTAGRIGARAQTTATSSVPQASTGAAAGSVGARAQSAGAKSLNVATSGLVGARGLAPGLKRGVAAALSRTGCTTTSPGLAARLGATLGRAGARGVVSAAAGPVTPRCPVTVGLRPYTVHTRTRDFNHDVPRRPLVLTVRNC